MQTKAINSSGVYRVGNITIENTTRSIFMSSEKMTLEHVMTLTVPIDQAPVDPRRHDDETEMRDLRKTKELKKYSLNDLKDLQSKLMLIAGKTAKLQNKDCIESTEEINKFVEVQNFNVSMHRAHKTNFRGFWYKSVTYITHTQQSCH